MEDVEVLIRTLHTWIDEDDLLELVLQPEYNALPVDKCHKAGCIVTSSSS